MQSGQSALTQPVTVNTDGTLYLQLPDRRRHTVLLRDAQTHVDVVGQNVPLKYLRPLGVQPIALHYAMGQPSDQELGLGTLAADVGHPLATLFRG